MKILLTLNFFFLLSFNACAEKLDCNPKDKECYTKSGYPACKSRVDLDKYYEFLETEKKEISDEIISDKNRCIHLKGGQKIIVQYYDNGKFKIFFRGPEKSYWVISEALNGSKSEKP